MEITKTMLTLASYDLISVNGKEKQNLPRAVCSFAGGGGVECSLAEPDPLPNRIRGERVWSNSHQRFVSPSQQIPKLYGQMIECYGIPFLCA